jgi:Mg-chelatase subunit ChlD
MSTPVAVCIVLDRSGSMEPRRESSRSAVNAYVAGLKTDAATADALVSLLIFDGGSIDVLRARVTPADWIEVAPHEYAPRGSTPLFDAVGRGVALLDADPHGLRRKLLVIVTDGEENASREHTSASIKALLTAKQEAGWTVLYMGADHDAWTQASSLGLSAAHVAEFRTLDRAADVLRHATVAVGCDVGSFNFSNADRVALE